jgi:hypothetical protein
MNLTAYPFDQNLIDNQTAIDTARITVLQGEFPGKTVVFKLS